MMPALVPCPECAGAGGVEAYDLDWSKAPRWIACERCNGYGEVEADPNVARFPVDADECIEAEDDGYGTVIIRRLVYGETRQTITIVTRAFAELAAWAVGRGTKKAAE